jgi:hypothetical protein
MKNIALVDVDGHNFPNLALCKIAGFYRREGCSVEWYSPLFSRDPDLIFASKVFTFTPDFQFAARHTPPILGGTGYDHQAKLPSEIEESEPDFSIYPDNVMRNPKTGNLQSYGFLTRGCIRNCPWCIVPKKEGKIKPVSTIEKVAQGRKEVILMDNNFLAAPEDFIFDQLARIRKLKIRIDFNQALDARLVTPKIAEALAKCAWIRYIRFSCDQKSMIEPVKRAVSMIRQHSEKQQIFIYLLVKEIEDAEIRLREMLKINVTPFAQPYRDFTENLEPTREQQNFAAFVNVKGGKMALKKDFKNYYRGRKIKNEQNENSIYTPDFLGALS